MKIWKIEIDFKEFKSYCIVDESREKRNRIKVELLMGKKSDNRLETEKIKAIEGSETADYSHLWGANIQLFSEAAKKILADILGDDVQLITMETEEKQLYAINVIKVLDAIDTEKSDFKCAISGEAISIEKYEFLKDVVKDNNIFKVYLNNRVYATEVFVSDKFKEVVEGNNLTGFKFIEVWNDTE